MIKKHFSSKIVALSFSMVLMVTLIFGTISFLVLKESITLQMRNDGLILVNALTREMEALDSNNLTEIHAILKDLKEKSAGGITYASVSNAQMEILVSDAGIYSDADSSATEVEESVDGDALVVEVSKEVINISGSMNNGDRFLNIGLSLDQMHVQIQKAMTQLLIASLVLLSFATAMSFIISKLMIRSLKQTMAQLSHLSSGDLSTPFETSRIDELGLLNQSLSELKDRFNRVIKDTLSTIQGLKDIEKAIGHSKSSLALASHAVSSSTADIQNVMENQEHILSDIHSNTNRLGNQILSMNEQAASIHSSSLQIEKASQEGKSNLSTFSTSMDHLVKDYEKAV